MPEMVEKVEQGTFITDEVSPAPASAGPVGSPPALLNSGSASSPGMAGERASPEAARGQGAQLPLPLDMDSEREPQPPVPAREKRQRRSKGFVPVTRDPDVARSYSDNVALDYAIARGLAQALTSLPPEELAALRAKVARAARQNGKSASSRESR